MLVGRHERFAVHDVDIQVVRVLRKVAAHDRDQIVHAFLVGLAERARRDREGVGNAVAAVFIAELCDRVERGQRARLVAARHRVRARRERLALAAAVRRVAGLFAVHHVGGDGQDGQGVDCTAIQWVLFQRLIELLDLLAGDGVHAVVVVAELREVALDRKVHDDAVLRVADGAHLGVLDRGERVRHAAHARDAERHQTAHLGVVQRHLALLVGVLVVHIVDGVHRGDIGLGQPRAVEVHAAADLVVIEHIALHDRHLRADLLELVLVAAAVDRHHHQLRDVGARAEELHVLAHAHRGNAARDRVIVAEVRTHHVVVLILKRIRVDRGFGDELLPVFGQLLAPQHGQVGLGRGV